MTAGGAVPRNGQHSEGQQQQPPNDPRSIGTRQSRDYRPNLNPYHGYRKPGFVLPHRKQLSHLMQSNTCIQGPCLALFSPFITKGRQRPIQWFPTTYVSL
ncbi:hypothetical protein ILYODFUR_020677 [Ilyodon furcidens]|uniref:Uncharacterized protein n=1 Tax=Ilyodon furcidens TaxID=33524 RepID=A0ABV0SMY1_9TELE